LFHSGTAWRKRLIILGVALTRNCGVDEFFNELTLQHWHWRVLASANSFLRVQSGKFRRVVLEKKVLSHLTCFFLPKRESIMLWEIFNYFSSMIIKHTQVLGEFQIIKIDILWVEFLCPLQHIHRLLQQVGSPSLSARLGFFQ
jgi:hypothetical protein